MRVKLLCHSRLHIDHKFLNHLKNVMENNKIIQFNQDISRYEKYDPKICVFSKKNDFENDFSEIFEEKSWN